MIGFYPQISGIISGIERCDQCGFALIPYNPNYPILNNFCASRIDITEHNVKTLIILYYAY